MCGIHRILTVNQSATLTHESTIVLLLSILSTLHTISGVHSILNHSEYYSAHACYYYINWY